MHQCICTLDKSEIVVIYLLLKLVVLAEICHPLNWTSPGKVGLQSLSTTKAPSKKCIEFFL
jgi:hypothetical protein